MGFQSCLDNQQMTHDWTNKDAEMLGLPNFDSYNLRHSDNISCFGLHGFFSGQKSTLFFGKPRII